MRSIRQCNGGLKQYNQQVLKTISDSRHGQICTVVPDVCPAAILWASSNAAHTPGDSHAGYTAPDANNCHYSFTSFHRCECAPTRSASKRQTYNLTVSKPNLALATWARLPQTVVRPSQIKPPKLTALNKTQSTLNRSEWEHVRANAPPRLLHHRGLDGRA